MQRSHSIHPWVGFNRERHRSFVSEMLGDQETSYNRVYFAIREVMGAIRVEVVTPRSRIRKSVAQEGTNSRAALIHWENQKSAEQQPWLHTIRVFKEQQGALTLQKLISSTMTPPGTCPSKVSSSGRVNFTQPLDFYTPGYPWEEEKKIYGQESFCPPKRAQENSLIALFCDRETSQRSSKTRDGVWRGKKNSIPTQPQLPFCYR